MQRTDWNITFHLFKTVERDLEKLQEWRKKGKTGHCPVIDLKRSKDIKIYHWPVPGAVCSRKLLRSGQHCNPYCSSESGLLHYQVKSLNTWIHKAQNLESRLGFIFSSTKKNQWLSYSEASCCFSSQWLGSEFVSLQGKGNSEHNKHWNKHVLFVMSFSGCVRVKWARN